MRKALQVLAGLLAVEVVVQAMLLAFGVAKMFNAIDEDGRTLTQAIVKEDSPDFPGIGTLILHGMNGTTLVPLIALALLVVSLMANSQIPGASKRGLILFAMVAVQVVLGMSAHGVAALAPIHALNGFGIFAMSIATVRKTAEAAPAAA